MKNASTPSTVLNDPVKRKPPTRRRLNASAMLGVPPAFTRMAWAGKSPSRAMASRMRGAAMICALTVPRTATIMMIRMNVSPRGPKIRVATVLPMNGSPATRWTGTIVRNAALSNK